MSARQRRPILSGNRKAKVPRKKGGIDMPVGGFLDLLPAPLFIAAHVFFLGFGIWLIVKTARDDRAKYGPALMLYVLSHIAYLAFFAGLLTLKMAVLIEQTLLFVAILWIATRQTSSRATSQTGTSLTSPAAEH